MNQDTDDFSIRQTVAPGHREIELALGTVRLHGDLLIPRVASGLILFAHGSGSSRLSPRNRYVAQALAEAGLASCLFDLLTPQEAAQDARTRALRFDLGLLAERLVLATDWMFSHLELVQPETITIPVGYFGASTGAAAALIAAADRPEGVKAVVSRGGRPDLAMRALGRVRAPTLLIVGGLDETVLDLNRQAYAQLPAQLPKELVVIPGAGHLFEEPGKLAQVASTASRWFEKYLTGDDNPRGQRSSER